jgi:hypothetical protein
MLASYILLLEKGFFSLGKTLANFEVQKDNIRVARFHQMMGAKILRESQFEICFCLERKDFSSARLKMEKLMGGGSPDTLETCIS